MTMNMIEMTKVECLSEQRKNYLEKLFEYATEKQMDELDFYMEILEHGYTEAHVHKYIGKEAAIHMREFCEEHGLL